ncbi:MAG TPA: DNA recombination protein RmuC [Candidatus Gracilibacteria bacterium]|nr:DNA recombination protein RmuC [Candidatus Gracilibacteria bacterium]
MDIALLILTIVAVGAVAVAVYFAMQKSKTSDNDTTNQAVLELNRRLDGLNQNVTQNLNTVTSTLLEQLNKVTGSVDNRLKENVEILQRQQKSINERLDNSANVIKGVTATIAEVKESNKKIHDMAKDLTSLQDILKSPKLRGGLGELFLEELLSQIFTKEQYSLQYRFKSGETVDAVVHLRNDQLVPVDAKFPLENFKKMIECKDEKEQASLRKLFVSDVKKHIDAIAKKYILPDEGTFDFALMYIPAENVYYETIIKESADESISQYGLSKRVIPVSPNSFNIYLHTILIGLRGMQIEKSARDIFNNLARLNNDFEKFAEDFELVGKHLGHAQSSYDNSEKRLQKFSSKLNQVAEKGGGESVVKALSENAEVGSRRRFDFGFQISL